MDAARAKLGVDRPLVVQYVSFLADAVRGDFGDSFRSRQPVTSLIAAEFPYTLQLAVGGFVVGLLLGTILGVIAGVRPNGWVDTVCMTAALAGLSLPSFWIGMILIQVFATQLGWVPVLGTGLDALILPSITLGLFVAGGLARLIRNSIIEAMSQDYIRTARAKGLSQARVVAKHAMRNALIPPHHPARHPVRAPDRRRGGDRDRVRPPRHRPPAGAGGAGEGLPRRAGRRGADHRGLCADQRADRHRSTGSSTRG